MDAPPARTHPLPGLLTVAWGLLTGRKRRGWCVPRPDTQTLCDHIARHHGRPRAAATPLPVQAHRAHGAEPLCRLCRRGHHRGHLLGRPAGCSEAAPPPPAPPPHPTPALCPVYPALPAFSVVDFWLHEILLWAQNPTLSSCSVLSSLLFIKGPPPSDSRPAGMQRHPHRGVPAIPRDRAVVERGDIRGCGCGRRRPAGLPLCVQGAAGRLLMGQASL